MEIGVAYSPFYVTNKSYKTLTAIVTIVMPDNTMYNPTLKVLLRFARVIYDNGSLRKTQLQMLSRMNSEMCFSYIEWAVKKGLIEITLDNDGNKYFSLTEAGKEFYQRTALMLEEDEPANTRKNLANEILQLMLTKRYVPNANLIQ